MVVRDTLSKAIDLFLNEHSGRIIEDWDLATKNDLSELEKKDLSELKKRFDNASVNFNGLEKRFDEYRGTTNKKLERTNAKLEDIEKRLEKLEKS